MPLCPTSKTDSTKERNKIGQGVRCLLGLMHLKLGIRGFHVIVFACHKSHFDTKQYYSENRVLSLGMKANEDLEPLQVVLSVLI
jgi:hypothetical protein